MVQMMHVEAVPVETRIADRVFNHAVDMSPALPGIDFIQLIVCEELARWKPTED